jgi:hypothetical protein
MRRARTNRNSVSRRCAPSRPAIPPDGASTSSASKRERPIAEDERDRDVGSTEIPFVRLAGPALLTGVSYTSPNWCVAVGATGDSTLAQTWNGHVWSVIASPAGPANFRTNFTGVSCGRAASCVATEHFTGPTPGSVHSGVEQWNGSSWIAGSGSASEPGGLGGVSCANKTFCFAVGGYSFPSAHGTTALLGRA